MPTIAPVPTIVPGSRPTDIQVIVTFTPDDPLASVVIDLDGEADLSPTAYVHLIESAAARLALYAHDFSAAAAMEC